MAASGERSGGRGLAAIQERMERTGLTGAGQPLWSEHELEVLKIAWPDRASLRRVLPGRTDAAIEHRAAKLRLCRRKRNHIWTSPQVARFKRMWPTATQAELLEAFPWALWGDLMNKAQDLRRREAPDLRRPKARPSSTGNAVLDSLLAQAHAANLTLGDLDLKARTGTYFAACRFRRYIAWGYVARAVEALGGELDADWGASVRVGFQ